MIIRGAVSTVPPNVETTVLSYTNSSITQYIRNIGIEGNAQSHWVVYKNLETIFERKLTTADITEQVSMFNVPLEFGDVLDIKVTSYGPTTNEFSSEMIIGDSPEDLNIVVNQTILNLIKAINGRVSNKSVLNGRVNNISSINGVVSNVNLLNGTTVLKNQLNGIIQDRLRINGIVRCK